MPLIEPAFLRGQVGVIAPFLALIVGFVCSLFVGKYLFYVAEGRVQNRARLKLGVWCALTLGWWLAFCWLLSVSGP